MDGASSRPGLTVVCTAAIVCTAQHSASKLHSMVLWFYGCYVSCYGFKPLEKIFGGVSKCPRGICDETDVHDESPQKITQSHQHLPLSDRPTHDSTPDHTLPPSCAANIYIT